MRTDIGGSFRRIGSPRASVALVASLLLISLICQGCTVRLTSTDSAVRYFPVGSSPGSAETGWRISWSFEPHPTKPGQQLWVITGADFLRGVQRVDGRVVEDWIRVLDRLTVSAMFVPYVEGSARYRDFVTYYTGLAKMDRRAATRRAYKPTFIHDDRIVRETTDDFIRWMENGSGGYNSVARLKRGQAMTVWGMFNAANYVYPMAFKFRDDGVIQVRIAASGQNLRDQPSLENAHLHMGAWQLEPHLCAVDNGACGPEDVVVETVSRRVVGGQEEIVVEPFQSGSEGGVDWRADEFTALLMTNPAQPNGRPIRCTGGASPPCTSETPVGYALIPVRYGAARYQEPGRDEGFLDHELWVTRKPAPPALAEPFFTEVHDYADGESLGGQTKVVWHKSSFNHIPRYEDLGFGTNDGFSSNQGVALATFTGFDLVPRNLIFETPLYTP